MRHALIRFLAALDVDAAWYVLFRKYIFLINSFTYWLSVLHGLLTTCPVFFPILSFVP